MAERVLACPYCGDKEGRHHKHLYVNTETEKFFCHLCNRGGTTGILLKDFPSISEYLDLAAVGRVRRRLSVDRSAEGGFISILDAPKNLYVKNALKYLEKRGLNRIDLLRVYWRRSTPARVIFVCKAKEQVVFWVARSIANAQPKYLFPKEGEAKLARSEALYNFERFENTMGGTMWLVEGVFDALAVNGVALFGKYASNKQLKRILARRPEKVIVGLDPDAKEEAEKLATKLVPFAQVEVRYPPPKYKDWGEALPFIRKTGTAAELLQVTC